MQLNLSHICYTYPGASSPALRGIDAVFPQGWTGIVGDNGCGKTTLALIAARFVRPDEGTVTPRLCAAYCAQDPSEEPLGLEDLALDWSREGRSLRETLCIEDGWLWRYGTLSGGQQKRIQIACALAQRPDVLVMDEPTNDLDAPTRQLVSDALAAFKGIGLLISHDRQLLDRLASQCLLFEDGCARMRPGGYTQASEQVAVEWRSAARAHAKAAHETRRLRAEAQRRSQEAARQDAKRSRRHLDKKDSDGRGRIGLAIVSGKDGVAGRLSATMDRRLARAEADLGALRAPKRYEPGLEGWGATARSSTVAHVEAAELRAGEFCIHVPELWVGRTDRIALCGANGTGKSLVARYVLKAASPSARTASIPQEVTAEQRQAALAALRACSADERGRILSLVARLNSDPDRVLDGSGLSPGELRKLLLAQQLLDDPAFLVLDEPTNHLDIGSIEALQAMLAAFPGAVLIVSHDAALVDAVAQTRWQTVCEEGLWRLDTQAR